MSIQFNAYFGASSVRLIVNFHAIQTSDCYYRQTSHAGAITGTFAGLPEGAKFTSNGRTYRITYQGGDGNDVVVTDSVAFSPAIPLLLLD